MTSDLIRALNDARFSPIISRVALIVADVEGDAKALEFVTSCLLDLPSDHVPAVEPLDARPAARASDETA